MKNETLPKYPRKSKWEKALEKFLEQIYLWIKDFRKKPRNMAETLFKLGELVLALVLLNDLGILGAVLAFVGIYGLFVVFK
jgi:hypothetical protein